MYTCIHTYIHIYTHIRTHAHTYVHTPYIPTHAYPSYIRRERRTHAYIPSVISKNQIHKSTMHMHIHTANPLCVHVRISHFLPVLNVCAFLYERETVHIHTVNHTYIHTHARKHTRTHKVCVIPGKYGGVDMSSTKPPAKPADGSMRAALPRIV